MSWRFAGTLPWEDPLVVAARYHGKDIALLYSGLRESFTGALSYLCIDPIEEYSGSDWAQLPPLPVVSDGLPLWVGYLGYGMSEHATHADADPITLPDFRLVRYATLLRFDHALKVIEIFHALSSPTPKECDMGAQPPAYDTQAIASLQLASNLTRAKYIATVADTIVQIHAGNFYQANITRKFFGTFAQTPDSWHIFVDLTAASPAPYSAYIRHAGTAILSSSPECFLSMDAHGVMTTRPIKGSARRSEDSAQDVAIQQQLMTSEKNHAENLMIVDLMRNDLARVSDPRSVEVMEQSALYSYRTIHHLISTIRAQKSPDITTYDAVRACFPAGSMTGAPKIAAMRWCAEKERQARGVYSGAIGWFGGGDTCDLSVVIRTLIIDGDRFEFQVGGGIVAESTPEEEWQETITKARGILVALGLSEHDVATL